MAGENDHLFYQNSSFSLLSLSVSTYRSSAPLFVFWFLSVGLDPGGGALPYMGYVGMCLEIGYIFFRFSILK